jgi:hypothetical protein
MTTTSKTPLRLAFVGMSGSGKTFWTRKLADAGHPALSCDDRIEERLRPQLAHGGYEGIGGVAAWMGWPDSPHYAAREAQYLREEITVLEETVAELENWSDRSLVLDTTGSVIYTGDGLLRRLRAQVTIVHLAASLEEQQLLIERYLNDPKPVLWRGAFQPLQGEAPLSAVKRCYPGLTAERRSRYKALAHCTIPIRELRHVSLDAAGLLRLVEQAMDRGIRCRR